MNISLNLPENTQNKTETPMDWEMCINVLQANMSLFLFDTFTGESHSPYSLDEFDRMTYFAMEYAVDFLEKHPPLEK